MQSGDKVDKFITDNEKIKKKDQKNIFQKIWDYLGLTVGFCFLLMSFIAFLLTGLLFFIKVEVIFSVSEICAFVFLLSEIDQ